MNDHLFICSGVQRRFGNQTVLIDLNKNKVLKCLIVLLKLFPISKPIYLGDQTWYYNFILKPCYPCCHAMLYPQKNK